jgi:hypothetical protein
MRYVETYVFSGLFFIPLRGVMPHSTVEPHRKRAGPEASMVRGRDVGENLIAETSAWPLNDKNIQCAKGLLWDRDGDHYSKSSAS